MTMKKMNKQYDRRQFLKFSGTCALAALIGSGCTSNNDKVSKNVIQSCPYGLTNDPYPGQCVNYIDSNGSGYCDFSEGEDLANPVQNDSSNATATQEPVTTQPTQVPTTSAPLDSADSSSELVVLCHRKCSYPGHCKRFRDNDGSGICDLSEGIDPSEL